MLDNRLIGLLIVFVPLSLLSFGGGQAIVADIQHQTVDVHSWLSNAQFTDMYAISRASPGPSTLVAALIGYQVAGFLGAFVACLAIYVPSSAVVYAATSWWQRHRVSPVKTAIERGLAPIAIGLIFAGALAVIEAVGRRPPQPGDDRDRHRRPLHYEDQPLSRRRNRGSRLSRPAIRRRLSKPFRRSRRCPPASRDRRRSRRRPRSSIAVPSDLKIVMRRVRSCLGRRRRLGDDLGERPHTAPVETALPLELDEFAGFLAGLVDVVDDDDRIAGKGLGFEFLARGRIGADRIDVHPGPEPGRGDDRGRRFRRRDDDVGSLDRRARRSGGADGEDPSPCSCARRRL